MNAHDLPREVALFREIRERIRIIYPETDEQTLYDTVSGETVFEEAIAEILRESLRAGAMGDGMDALIAKNKERQARHYKRQESLRALAAWALGEVGQTKLAMPDMTVSIRPGKPKLIIQEGALSAQFIKHVMTTKVDREAIQAAVDAGEVPAGVEVSNGSSVLTVRLK